MKFWEAMKAAIEDRKKVVPPFMRNLDIHANYIYYSDDGDENCLMINTGTLSDTNQNKSYVYSTHSWEYQDGWEIYEEPKEIE